MASIESQLSNDIYMIKAEEEDGIYYHFAIIDYF